MGLFDFIRKKRLDRLEKDLRMVQNRIAFNPKKATLNIEKYLSDSFTQKITEYKVWNTGNSFLLRQFYYTAVGYDELYKTLNYFWRNAPAEYIKKHSGIPQQISNKNGVIIFGGDFKASVNVYKKDENGNISNDIDEAQSKKATDTLNAIIEKSNIMQSLRKQAVIDSWCGHSVAKLNYDLTLSQYPIYEVYDLTQAEVLEKRGIIIGYLFKSYYKVKDIDYCFEEEYTKAVDDTAIIFNRLYRMQSDGSRKEVPLTTIPQTAEYEESYIFNDLKDFIAFAKPNKLPNNEYSSTPYGASDYQGAIDSFDALDEAYSELYSELRNNKTIRYIPEMMIPKDENGKAQIRNTGFITNYQAVQGSLDQDAKNKIEIQPIDDKTESILNKYRNALTTAINNAGLSPLALGITGLEAINAGEASQKERNRVTLETRKDKIENYWKPYLKHFFTQLLAFNNWMVKKAGAKQTLDNFDIDFDNCDIQLDFGNYIVEDETNIINRWGTAKQAGLASIDTCVRELHPDWTEEQIMNEINLIKYEQGLDLDNPNNLPELTGVDDGNEETTEPNE